MPRTGPSTLRLSWTGTADLRFTVFNSATGQKLGETLTAANPKSVTLSLQAGVAYYLHDAGYLAGHAGKFLHRLDLSIEAPHAPSVAEPRYASATVPAH